VLRYGLVADPKRDRAIPQRVLLVPPTTPIHVPLVAKINDSLLALRKRRRIPIAGITSQPRDRGAL
jgi:hypothetical protein